MKRFVSATVGVAWLAFYASVWVGCVFFTPPSQPETVRYCLNWVTDTFEPCDNFVEVRNV